MFSKNRSILILGILTALMPFLGFPTSWKNVFYFIFGISISTMSFLIARHKRISKKTHVRKDKSAVVSKKEIVQSDIITEYVEPLVEEVVVTDTVDLDVSENVAPDLEQESKENI
jgi:hypothetical protein